MTPETIFFPPDYQCSSYDSSLSCNVSKGLIQNIMIDSHRCIIFLARRKKKKKNRGGALYSLKADWPFWIHFAYLGQCSFLPRNMQPSQSALFQWKIICSPLAQYVGNHLQCPNFYLHSPVFRDHLHKILIYAFLSLSILSFKISLLLSLPKQHLLQKRWNSLFVPCLKVSVLSQFDTK